MALSLYRSLEYGSPIKLAELGKAIASLKENRSPEENGSMLNGHLIKVFNDIWSGNSYLSRFWVDPEVISIFKKKELKTDPTNPSGRCRVIASYIYPVRTSKSAIGSEILKKAAWAPRGTIHRANNTRSAKSNAKDLGPGEGSEVSFYRLMEG